MVSDLSRAKRLLAASYDHAAADFARYADGLVYSHLAGALAAAIEPYGEPVLDVAGGTGALSRRLSDVVVADISFGQLINNPVRDRAQGDAESLPFIDDCFAVAASAFGLNHFPDAQRAVREMARVAPCIGVLTWARPEAEPFAPKVIVLEAIARHTGRAKTEAGEMVDALSDAVGSPEAVQSLLEGAGTKPRAEYVDVQVPWPGTEAFIDYRLSMMGPGSEFDDFPAFRAETAAAIDALNDNARKWRAKLVLGLGVRG